MITVFASVAAVIFLDCYTVTLRWPVRVHFQWPVATPGLLPVLLFLARPVIRQRRENEQR